MLRLPNGEPHTPVPTGQEGQQGCRDGREEALVGAVSTVGGASGRELWGLPDQRFEERAPSPWTSVPQESSGWSLRTGPWTEGSGGARVATAHTCSRLPPCEGRRTEAEPL